MQDLGTLGGPNSYAIAINQSGQITGYADVTGSDSGDSLYHAFLYSGGSMNDLGTVGGYTDSDGIAISSGGEVVGALYSSSLGTNSFIYLNGQISNLSTLIGLQDVTGVNDSNHFIGYQSSGASYVYMNGSLTSLGRPAGFDEALPKAINNAGQIVGAFDTGGTEFNAFIWSNGVLANLNSDIAANSGWVLQQALDINDNGQIVGYGLNPSGYVHGYLLTPLPEPSGGAMILLCAMCTLRRGFRSERGRSN
jgi:probable HAF family extracellular repeat protein